GTDGVDARSLGEGLAGEGVEALDARGHAAGADVRDLLRLADLGAAREIALVRRAVRGGELLVALETLGELGHQTGRLEPGELEGEPGKGEVERGRERGAVLETRRGAHHGGAPAAAAPRDRDDAAHVAAELEAHDLEVARRGGRLVGKRGE